MNKIVDLETNSIVDSDIEEDDYEDFNEDYEDEEEITNDDDEIDKIEDIDDVDDGKTKNIDDEDDEEYDSEKENDELSNQIEIDDEINNQLNISSEHIELIVHPNERITSNYLSKLEYSNVIGLRAKDISEGAPIYVDIDGLNDPIDIANKELYENKFPISVKRHIGLNYYEIWECNELIKKKYI